MNESTLVGRILARLQGGDEAKIERFSEKLEKYFTVQIRIKREKIEQIEDRIKDELEDVQDTVLGVDVATLNKGVSVDSYCPLYVGAVDKARKVIEKSKLEIEEILDEIADLEANRDIIFKTKEETVKG